MWVWGSVKCGCGEVVQGPGLWYVPENRCQQGSLYGFSCCVSVVLGVSGGAFAFRAV